MDVARLGAALAVVVSVVLAGPSPAQAATFSVTYTSNRYDSARSHTHDGAEGTATRTTQGPIGFDLFNPDTPIPPAADGWHTEGGTLSAISATFTSDAWNAQYLTSTPDLHTSWQYWRADFGGGTYIVSPASGQSETACSNYAPPPP
jgi:hypothetical protein